MNTPYLKQLTTVTIPPTKNEDVILYATNVFTGYIDSDFKNWNLYKRKNGNEATIEREVSIYEQIKDGTFDDIFKSFNTDLDALCLTQSQIIEFCRRHKEQLHPQGYSTFFIFKEYGEYYVADTRDPVSKLGVVVRIFDRDYGWGAEGRRRIVVPKLSSLDSCTDRPLNTQTLSTSDAFMLGYRLGKYGVSEELANDIKVYIK